MNRNKIILMLLFGMSLLFAVIAYGITKEAGSENGVKVAPIARGTHTTHLADRNLARQAIVVRDNLTSSRTLTAAHELAEYLKKITGARFSVVTGNGTKGIAVGVPGDFPLLHLEKEMQITDQADRDKYMIRSTPDGLYLVGAKETGVEHAVWDLLYRLGYRQFFPTQKWEIIPDNKTLDVTINALEKPDYIIRWTGFYSYWDGLADWEEQNGKNSIRHATWSKRNRIPSDIVLGRGHVYPDIYTDNKASFDTHPEFFALRKRPDGTVGRDNFTVNPTAKFCASNPGLQQACIDYANRFLDRHPNLESVSMMPSDGEADFCTCSKCAVVGDGGETDQALYLANVVADNISARGKYVFFPAYLSNAPPPSIKVSPNVIIFAATYLTVGGYTPEQLLAGWAAKGAQLLGVREYHAVYAWDRDLPGAAYGGNLGYLKKSIPDFYNLGVRYMVSEASDSWGPLGLGNVLSARFQWDIKEAGRNDELKADFFDKAFGDPKAPAVRDLMAGFYELMDGTNTPLLSADLVGRMYGYLNNALNQVTLPAVRARINDLVLYTRYVELYRNYSIDQTGTRQEKFKDLIMHVYRIHGTEMVDSLPIYRQLGDTRRVNIGPTTVTFHAWDKKVHIPENCKYNDPKPQNTWKIEDDYSDLEIHNFARRGVAGNPTVNITPVNYSDDLVPAMSLKLYSGKDGNFGSGHFLQKYYTWVSGVPGPITLSVTAGTINPALGKTMIDVYPGHQPRSVLHVEVPPDKTRHTITLRIPAGNPTGLYRIEINDSNSGTDVMWDNGMKMTAKFGRYDIPQNRLPYTLYFYVPKGTKYVGGYSDGGGKLCDGNNVLRYIFPTYGTYFNIPVPVGQDGKVWCLFNVRGDKRLMTVPPFVARRSDELLLPREVVP